MKNLTALATALQNELDRVSQTGTSSSWGFRHEGIPDHLEDLPNKIRDVLGVVADVRLLEMDAGAFKQFGSRGPITHSLPVYIRNRSR